mmetsp:Transcript_15651/g.33790  ORF Transcript_15651/g.33790 Transcript_15651/m.33790 type:complete len:277 (-) Transcript_15651:971-1801(-)
MDFKRAEGIIQSYKQGEVHCASNENLWKARKIVDNAVHPDTGETIPPPFRMSGFVPFGTPVIVGMLLASTPGQNVFWQWVNQSHNAAINFFNANKTAPVSPADVATSYVVATGSAVSVCLALDKLVLQLKKPTLVRFVPFVAVATANVINVCMMRRKELEHGISVFDQSGNALGESVVAAKKALLETSISRVVLPVPILVISPLVMLSAEKVFPWVKSNPRVRIPVQAAIVSCTFLFGLPFSLSLFRDRGEIEVSNLEPNIQNRTTFQHAYYNKGL